MAEQAFDFFFPDDKLFIRRLADIILAGLWSKLTPESRFFSACLSR